MPLFNLTLFSICVQSVLCFSAMMISSAHAQVPNFSGREQLEQPQGQVHERRTVIIPAGELLSLSEQLGFAPVVEFEGLDPVVYCHIVDHVADPNRPIRAVYFGPVQGPLSPPPSISDDFRTCQIQFLGVTLQNGWELVELRDIDARSCVGDSYTHYSLRRRSRNLTDTTHDLELAGWRVDTTGHPYSEVCIIEIRHAVLRGPVGSPYNDAFNY